MRNKFWQILETLLNARLKTELYRVITEDLLTEGQDERGVRLFLKREKAEDNNETSV